MSHLQKVLKTAAAVICIISILSITSAPGVSTAYASCRRGFVLLDTYSKTMNAGDTFDLAAAASNGKKPGFSSDNSKVASVNARGRITAKKAGTAVIKVKIKNAEARCKITVKKAVMKLSAKKLSLKAGERAGLKVTVPDGKPVIYKSGRPNVASVNKKGVILAKSTGTAAIAVTSGKNSAVCQVVVKPQKVTFSRRFVRYLYESPNRP